MQRQQQDIYVMVVNRALGRSSQGFDNTLCYKHLSFKHGFKLWLTVEDVHIIILIFPARIIQINLQ